MSGPLLELFESLDARFRRVAGAWNAEPLSFLPLLPVGTLRAAGYFSSFPHQVIAPVSPESQVESLQAFGAANPSDGDGPLRLGRVDPIESVLAPAACYAVYPMLAGAQLEQARTFTVRCTCFRREKEFLPLRRQSCFNMREVVHVGSEASVRRFLETAEEQVLGVARELRLPLAVAPATDLFFDPSRSSRLLHQKLFAAKREFLFDDELAVGSLNTHRTFFAELATVSVNGALAHTACLAFGLERWVWAVLKAHGTDARSWPKPL